MCIAWHFPPSARPFLNSRHNLENYLSSGWFCSQVKNMCCLWLFSGSVVFWGVAVTSLHLSLLSTKCPGHGFPDTLKQGRRNPLWIKLYMWDLLPLHTASQPLIGCSSLFSTNREFEVVSLVQYLCPYIWELRSHICKGSLFICMNSMDVVP